MDVSANTTPSVELAKASWNAVMGRAKAARDRSTVAVIANAGSGSRYPLLGMSRASSDVPTELWLLARKVVSQRVLGYFPWT